MNDRFMDNSPKPMPGYMPLYPRRMRGMELAQANIPYQQYTVSFPPMEALEKGTMFPELYRPYEVKKK